MNDEIKQKLAELPSSKLYFSMREVVDFCQLEASAIRYWETKFKALSPKKNNNQRRYQYQDIKLILIIKHLLYQEKLTIQGAVKKLAESKKNLAKQNTSSQDLSSQGSSSQDLPSQGSSSQDLPSQGSSSQDLPSQGSSLDKIKRALEEMLVIVRS